jgi:putative N6-adenine-specific DNA methylase
VSESRFHFFASVTPGIERWLHAECLSLVPDAVPIERRGGVALQGTLAELSTVVRQSRLAESVRVRVKHFDARSFPALNKGLEKVPWHAWIAEGDTPDVKVVCRKSKLIHSGAVESRAREVIDRCLRRAPSQTIGTVHVRIVNDKVTISVDASDELLHRRGWRAETGEASFRETLAAAMLRAADWDGSTPLYDPFCGAGTICLEAASIVSGAPVRAEEDYAFLRWPTAQRFEFTAPPTASAAPASARIFGSDKSMAAIKQASANAAAGSFEPWCRFEKRLAGDIWADVPEGATVVTNLPYGRRLSPASVEPALRQLGELIRARPDLGPVVVMTPRTGLKKATGLQWEALATMQNRGLHVNILRLDRSKKS